MLVLTRKSNERIVIEGGIELVVLSIQGNRVRLGIAAPASVAVHRGELFREASDESEIELACHPG